jgi:hypothetical protein
LENLKGRDHLEDLGIDVKMMIEFILWKYGGRMWTEFMWLRLETTGMPL